MPTSEKLHLWAKDGRDLFTDSASWAFMAIIIAFLVILNLLGFRHWHPAWQIIGGVTFLPIYFFLNILCNAVNDRQDIIFVVCLTVFIAATGVVSYWFMSGFILSYLLLFLYVWRFLSREDSLT